MPGFDFTPSELLWKMKVLAARDREKRQQMAVATAVGMSGDKQVWDTL